ncbi:MAG: hypothetical protein P8K68_14655 [Algibacter sp.]|uniref:hypothetical protein n=1 Tax=Algibacter sp. TaxID=1872428 RepID=UPI00260AC787|nr:hypothetical protein [Algibacter sp.]MDG1728239.1 hypothetical protein [Algibacter sp.]MDG2180006.1 hypothetical protein [Algibacter sp.]
MSAFIDDFFEGDAFDSYNLEPWTDDILSLQEDYDTYIIFYNDLKASINNDLYLSSIDICIPIREINIMIERINDIKRYKISKYGVYRDCENYLVKTAWFSQLEPTKKFKICFDFYTHIVLGIHEAFNRA